MFGQDKTKNDLDIAIKGHLLQKPWPPPSSDTYDSDLKPSLLSASVSSQDASFIQIWLRYNQ